MTKTNDKLGLILTNMVENTVIFLTNDLPSLLEQDRIARIRRIHKNEILKNIPEAKQAIEAYIKEREKAASEYWRAYYGVPSADQDIYGRLNKTQRKALIDYHTKQLEALNGGNKDE